jgi:Spy/CpxP family protein refolding chaperone
MRREPRGSCSTIHESGEYLPTSCNFEANRLVGVKWNQKMVGRFDMKKWIIVGTVLILASLSLAFAGYQSGLDSPHGFRGPRGHFISQGILALLENDQFRSRINLTDDQANHLRQIIVDAEKSTIETRARIAVDGIELRELLRADKPDQDAVMKKAEEITRLRGQMMKDGIQAILDAKNALTPEQQKKVRELMESRLSRGAWGGRWMEHGRGGMMRPQGPRNIPPPSGRPRQ